MKSLLWGVLGALLGYQMYPMLHPPRTLTPEEKSTGESSKGPPQELTPARVTKASTSPPAKETPSSNIHDQELSGSLEVVPELAVSEDSREAVVKSKTSSKKPIVETPDSRWMTFMQRPYLEGFSGADRRILGRFEGTLTRTDGNLDSVLLRFFFREREKVLEGGSVVSLVDSNGKEYARHADRGGNRTVKAGPSENSYFVEVSPSSYLVLSFKHYPQLAGTYFERGRPAGTVELRKIDP